MTVSQIKQVAVGKLRANPANVRTHPKKQIAQIARSIEQFGFVVPLVADEHMVIQAGQARLEAGLSDAERRVYLLADSDDDREVLEALTQRLEGRRTIKEEKS